MSRDLPRIVVISMTSLSCSNATGSLLLSLFQNWPNENILQISTHIPKDEVTSSYNLFYRPKSCNDLPIIGTVLRKTKVFDTYCINWKNLFNTVSRFKPDILYARVVGHPLFFSDISYKLTSKLGIPMVCHIMDDYEGLFSTSTNILERYIIKTIFVHQLKKLLNASKKNYAISPNMAEAFSKRYNCHFTPLHNGIDPALWEQKKNKTTISSYKKKVFRLVLAGALAPEKEGDVARSLAQAVDRLNNEGGNEYELILNIQEHFLPFAKHLAREHTGVKAQPYLSLQQYRELLQNADLLVLARNFDDRSKAYTEYSFQNKLPEYMASGSPILCIGPTWENSIKFLQNRSAGETLTDCSPERIKHAIVSLHKDPHKRKVLAIKAKHIALSEFNIATMRERFQQSIIRLTNHSKLK